MTLLEPKALKTRFDPCIIVKRLRVERQSRPAFDENFHTGVNVLRGDNASGKSTILNFLFFGLGGDLYDWSEAAIRCSFVFVEVEFNGNIATLCREVSNTSKQPMDIFAGPMATALLAPKSEWKRYPYSRSQSIESYSQVLFRLIGIPEVRGGVSETVTVHQMLRLLYADQLSPVDSIFKFELFDPPTLRDAVGRLLCGAYDNEMYQNELRIRELNREFDSLSAELSSLLSVLGRSGDGMTLSWVTAEREVLAQRRKALREEIANAERNLFTSEANEAMTLAAQRKSYDTVQKLQEQLVDQNTQVDKLKFAIADSNAFIASLERKMQALREAKDVAEYIIEVHFEICPACLARLEPQDKDKHSCHLCHTSFDSERAKGRLVALINDTGLQLKQSTLLQANRERDLAKSMEKLGSLEQEWITASNHLIEIRSLPSGSAQETMRELNRSAGYLEREIEDLEKKTSIATLVDELSTRKASLNAQITKLKSENEARKAAQERQLSRAYNGIANEVRTLLHNDLPRQDSFIAAKNVDFDFASNHIYVDEHKYFSASSRVILKSSFYLGFISAAMKDLTFRHPRFCVIDTIEDKGMEIQRSHNFQHLIANVSAASETIHQIIFATAMISPELDDERFTVGKYSTREDPTLDYKVIDQ